MPSFVYAPAIEVHVSTREGIIDVSEDLVSWTMTRRENAVSTFSFRLQNTQRKFDGKLLPMDRITVRMKRIAWVQTFTGYLNDGIIFQAWPGEIDISASCTLKRLQYWYWDPGLNVVQALIRETLNAPDSTGKIEQNSSRGDRNQGALLRKLVSTITQQSWPESHIHISDIPEDWFAFASTTAGLIAKDTEDYRHMGGFSLGGQAFANREVIPAGSYGGTALDAKQVGWAALVYQEIVLAEGHPSWMATLALMCCLTESSLRNLANTNVAASLTIANDGTGSDHASVGLFQQQTGTAWSSATSMGTADGWGTPVELMIAPKAASKFINGAPGIDGLLKKLAKDNTGQYINVVAQGKSAADHAVQAVQGSGPDAYAKSFDAAVALTQALDAAAAKPGVVTGDLNPSVITPTAGPGTTGTGSQLAATAMALINAHTAPHGDPIVYAQRGDSNQNTPIDQVTVLDCSSLVNWCYYHTTNQAWPGSSENGRGPASGEQWSGCVKDVALTYDIAVKIQGALLFGGVNGSEHIGISLGNGKHVAAHDHYDNPALDCTISSCVPSANFHESPVMAALAPHIDYTSAGTDEASMAVLRKLFPGKTITKAAGISTDQAPSVAGSTGVADGSGNDQFRALLQNLVLANPVVDPISESLGGRLALINDQPFLPWVEHYINSMMRSFCSAPNGDLIAWWPDYFNLWGRAGVIKIQPIELMDFAVQWSDADIVTHQFVLGNVVGDFTSLDQTTGDFVAGNEAADLISLARGTAGIATMEYPEIFQAIYGRKASAPFVEQFLQRFGARPQVDMVPNIYNGDKTAFFMALYRFMQRWAGQFNATVPVTFMPEVFPGMVIQIPEYGFQAYVTEVTHSGSYGPGGGFQTQISIVAPSSTFADRSDLLSLLPNVSSPFHGPDISKAPGGVKKPAKNPAPPARRGQTSFGL